MDEIDAKRKELENRNKLYADEHFNSLDNFNLGVEMARKEFIEEMVFMLSKHFQSTSKGFIEMLPYNRFVGECYAYLKLLGEKQ